MEAVALRIEKEEDAWQILLDALSDKLPQDIREIQFVNWPTLEITLRGKQYQSSLTPGVMAAFIQLQQDIFRAYAKIHHGSSTARVLTDAEKKALEIVVLVGPGSSALTAILKDAANKLAEGMVKTMEPKHWITVLLGAALVWGGDSSWKAYLQTQKEIKEIEANQFADEIDLKRMEILAKATQASPELVIIRQGAEEVYNAVLKGSSGAESVQIAGMNIQQSVVQDLVRPQRSKSGEVQLNGICRIQKVDSSKLQGFMVEVKFEDGRIFPAKLDEAVFITKDKNKRLIQEAEWEKKPIYLMMNGRELRGDITQATIIDVKEVSIE